MPGMFLRCSTDLVVAKPKTIYSFSPNLYYSLLLVASLFLGVKTSKQESVDIYSD